MLNPFAIFGSVSPVPLVPSIFYNCRFYSCCPLPRPRPPSCVSGVVAAGEKLTVKDRTKLKRERGQTGLDTRVWKSETEMQLRQQFD